MSELRTTAVYLAAFLALLSIKPLRRKVPVLRSIPAGLELGFWLGLAFLCAAAIASVQTHRSIELGLATGRSAIYFVGQAMDSLLSSLSTWVAAHEQRVVLATVGIVAFSWLLIFVRALATFRRALEPRPRLGDWWVLTLKHPPRRRSRPLESAQAGALPRQATLSQVDPPARAVPRTSVAR